jgi:hypothetical protein
MSWIKRCLSPSLVISIIALFVALGGTAFALAGNSVGARQLKAIVMREEEHSIAPGHTRVIDVKCHRGEKVTGGGVEELGNSAAAELVDSHPRGNGWEAAVTNTGSVAHDVDAEALCLTK